MIMRTWRGVVRRVDADRYADYIRETGFAEYGETPGNRGAWLRDLDGETIGSAGPLHGVGDHVADHDRR